MVTDNTFNTGGNWSAGEATISFQPGPIFSVNTSSYWAPTYWFQLDQGRYREIEIMAQLFIPVVVQTRPWQEHSDPP
jgi:hypothetical protein